MTNFNSSSEHEWLEQEKLGVMKARIGSRYANAVEAFEIEWLRKQQVKEGLCEGFLFLKEFCDFLDRSTLRHFDVQQKPSFYMKKY